MKHTWKKKAVVWTTSTAMVAISMAMPNTIGIVYAEEAIQESTQIQEEFPEESSPVAAETEAETQPADTTASQETIAPAETEASLPVETEPSAQEPSTEETTEEATTEEETTVEETTEEPTTEEAEWGEDAAEEDTHGLSFSYSEDGQTMTVVGFDGSTSVVEIPETYQGVKVTAISAAAFRDMTGITDVILPEGIVSIGREAFAGCTNLSNIVIPASLEQLGAYAFDGTIWDKSLTGDLVYINSILYRCQTDASEITIADGTKVIAEEAFINRTQLQKIVIPEGLTYIGSKAFAGCSALNEISFPQSLQNIVANAMDDTAWYEARKDDIIVINEKLLYRIPKDMTAVIIPEGVETICTLACADTEVETVLLPSTLNRILYGAFMNCTNLKEITIPEGTAYIESAAFQNCTSLSNAVLSNSLTFLGAAAFAGCTSLHSIVIPEQITRIYSYTFLDCTALKDVVIPANVTSVGSYAFAHTALTTIVLPANLTAIYPLAFSGCTALNGIELPAGLTYLGEGAFSDCSSLQAIVIPSGIIALRANVLKNCSSLTSVILPENLKYIGESAFSGDSALTAITLPQTLLTICAHAFENTSLINGFVLPGKLRTVGDYAFAGCTNLTDLTIPASIRTMGSQVFNGCTSLNLLCSFSSTTYIAKRMSGWNEAWADTVASVQFTGGAASVTQETKEAFLQTVLNIPDFASAEVLNNEFYAQLIGAICAEDASKTAIVDDTWTRVSELYVMQAINDRLGILLPDVHPEKTEDADFYYESGYYYYKTANYPQTASLSYLIQAEDENGNVQLLTYDAASGKAFDIITVTLQTADNETGMKVISKSSTVANDGNYLNVYESEEVRNLSNALNGSFADNQGSIYYFDCYSRTATVTLSEDSILKNKDSQTSEGDVQAAEGSNGEIRIYQYTCSPSEECDYVLTITDQNNATTWNFAVQKNAETATLLLSSIGEAQEYQLTVQPY